MSMERFVDQTELSEFIGRRVRWTGVIECEPSHFCQAFVTIEGTLIATKNDYSIVIDDGENLRAINTIGEVYVLDA